MPMQLHDQSGHVAGEGELGERHGARFLLRFFANFGLFFVNFAHIGVIITYIGRLYNLISGYPVGYIT